MSGLEPEGIGARSRDAAPRRRKRPNPVVPIVLAVVALTVIFGLLLGRIIAPPSGRSAGSLVATSPPAPATLLPDGPGIGYLVSLQELQQRAALAASGQEPYRSAVSDLLAFAQSALQRAPEPQNPLSIPGTTGPFVDDSAAAYGLALAYGVTGDVAYAQQARTFLMAWVDTTHSTLGTCPDSGACQTSLIMSRAAPGFVFAADLITGSAAFSTDDAQRFASWLRTIVLPAASRLDNNWGDAGTFTRLAVTAYLDDAPAFAAAVAKWRSQQDLIAADGHIPLEVRRGHTGMSYTQEALDYKVAGAEIAGRRGIDLWDYRGAGGATLKQAIDYLAKYWFDSTAWPWYRDPTTVAPSGMWEIAYEHWPTAAWQPIIAQRRPYGDHGHSAIRWTTLTNGMPFGSVSSSASPAP